MSRLPSPHPPPPRLPPAIYQSAAGMPSLPCAPSHDFAACRISNQELRRVLALSLNEQTHVPYPPSQSHVHLAMQSERPHASSCSLVPTRSP